MRIIRLFASLALAATLSAEASLAGVDFGRSVQGPTATAAGLRGTVVLWCYWSATEDSSLTAIPSLTKWNHLHGDKLTVVACQVDDVPAATVTTAWAKSGGDTWIAVIQGGGLSGVERFITPACYLFDHQGTFITSGTPEEVAPLLGGLVAQVPDRVVVEREYDELKAQAEALQSEADTFNKALKSVRKALEGRDEDKAAEAVDLIAWVGAWSHEKLREVKSYRAEEPALCLSEAERYADLLRGDELGQPFDDYVAALKAEPGFEKELKAGELLEAFQAKAVNMDMSKDRNRALALKNLRKIIEHYPGTAAAKEAAELAEGYDR